MKKHVRGSIAPPKVVTVDKAEFERMRMELQGLRATNARLLETLAIRHVRCPKCHAEVQA